MYTKDYWVVKLNSTGDIEWQNTIGGAGDDYIQAIRQTPDGGYILGGYSFSKFPVIKLNLILVARVIGL